MTYLDKSALLAALTQLQERDYPEQSKEALDEEQAQLRVSLQTADDTERARLYARLAETGQALADITLLGGQVRIRELTAAQRQQANDAATAEEDSPADNALFRALVIQMGVKEPSLTPSDVAALRSGRSTTVQRLAVAILSLSEATPEAVRLKSGQDDQAEPDT